MTRFERQMEAVDGALAEVAYAALSFLENARGLSGGFVFGRSVDMRELRIAVQQWRREERRLVDELSAEEQAG